DHVADGARRFLRFGAGVEAELAHRIDDAALHRLEAVAEEGQGAVEHDVHRIVEVGAFGVFAQGDLFETVENRTYGVAHGVVRALGKVWGAIVTVPRCGPTRRPAMEPVAAASYLPVSIRRGARRPAPICTSSGSAFLRSTAFARIVPRAGRSPPARRRTCITRS